MSYQYTASANGAVHLIRADETTPGFTLCGRRASRPGFNGGRRISWPRWGASDRGGQPIQRSQCERCASAARE